MAQSKNGPGKRAAGKAGANGPARAERQAAYFLSLTLENVRCFGPKQTLNLSDGNGKPAPWTIILGLNGTGKTTVLQLLAGFEEVEFEGRSPDEEPDPRLVMYHPSDPHIFGRTGIAEDSEWKAVVATSTSVSSRPDWVTERVHHLYRGQHLGFLDQTSPEGNVCSPWCCGYGASRRMGSSLSGDRAARDSASTLFSDRVELRNPEDWLLRLDYSASKPSKAQQQQRHRLAQVKDLLLSLMPKGEVTDINLIASVGPNPTPRAEFKTPYGWVPLKQLGYGYQTLITWVADFANRLVERYPDSPDPLAEPAVCLVDEIDLHLHPKWQRELMGFLTKRFPNTQFIATAHSPLVAQAAADANLAVLRREGDHVVIDNDVDDIRNWRVDQILTSDLFGLETARPPQIEKLLVERRVLLTQAKLSVKDRKRVKELDELIGELPFGETDEERRERADIRKTMDLLMKDRKPAQ